MTDNTDINPEDLAEVLQLICIKCRSNVWGPATPRKTILNNLHDIASAALTGDMAKARKLAGSTQE